MMRIEIRTTAEEKLRWQALAGNKGVSLSALVRSLLDGQRLRKRREPPKVDPVLLRDLARIGNNLNQLARAANRRQPVEADDDDRYRSGGGRGKSTTASHDLPPQFVWVNVNV